MMKTPPFIIAFFLSMCFLFPVITDADNAGLHEIASKNTKSSHINKAGDQSKHAPGIQLLGGTLVRYEKNGISVKHDIQVVDWDGVSPDGSSHQLVVTYPDGITTKTAMTFDDYGDTWGNYWISDPVPSFEDIQPGVYTYQVIDSAGNASVTITDVLEPEMISVVDETGIIYTNQQENGTSPIFSWNLPSANTVYYNVRAYDNQGKRIYSGYTSDLTHRIPPGILNENSDYFLEIRSFNNHLGLDIDNQAVSSRVLFRTGNISQEPYIDLTTWQGIKTWNSPRRGPHLSPWIEVYDAQGAPGNISYVKVIFPDGKERPLYFVKSSGDVKAEYGTDYFDAMTEGDYTFVVMDKDGNKATATEHFSGTYLDAMDPASLHPAQNDIITGDMVDFSWQTVNNAKVYSLTVYDENGNSYISRKTAHPENSVYLSSALFSPGKRYSYKLRATNDYDDRKYQHQSAPDWEMFNRTFTVSPVTTGSHAPAIDLNGWGVAQYQSVKPDGSGTMSELEFYIKVTDEDGVKDNIKQVVVRNSVFGEEILYLMNKIDETTATYYNCRYFERMEDIPAGAYTFEVTDYDGNVVTAVDEIETVKVGVPANAAPYEGSTVSATPSFSWSAAENASFYQVRIYNGWTRTLLWSGRLTETDYQVSEENRLDSENKIQDIFQYRVYAYHEDPEGEDIDNYSISNPHPGMMPYFFNADEGAGGFSVDMGPVVEGGDEMKLSVLLNEPSAPHDAWIILFTPDALGEPFGGTFIIDSTGVMTADDGYSYNAFALNNTDKIEMDIWEPFNPCSISEPIPGIDNYQGRWGVYWLSAPSHPEISGNADKLLRAISDEIPIQYKWFDVICR